MARLDEALNYKDKTTNEYGCLINKLNLYDQELLDKVEREITTIKASKLYLKGITGKFNKEHFLSIHKYLFDDIYPFAGETRNEPISKTIPFCDPRYIDVNLETTLKKANIEYKRINNKEDLVKFISILYSDLDAIHPFREGNGRCLREFIRQYIIRINELGNIDNEYYIDYSQIDNKNEFIKAVIIADAYLDTSYLEQIMNSIIIPINKNLHKHM